MHRNLTARTLFAALLWLCAVGALAEQPALLLATDWEDGTDPAGWWMSEKFDGIRGYWDGRHMLSRGGNMIQIPESWRRALPAFPMDGELWAGRGGYEQVSSTVRDLKPGPGWSAIRYRVFDLPQEPGGFEQRMAALKRWHRDHPLPWLLPVRQVRCAGQDHLLTFLKEVEQQGGEGIMLRAPGSPYTAGRSPHLRKYKSFDDTEAVIRGYRPGRGKYVGMVGALEMELPDGTRFAIGSGLSDAQRHDPPPIGSVVTFKHWGWTRSGKPRFPVFWRLRAEP